MFAVRASLLALAVVLTAMPLPSTGAPLDPLPNKVVWVAGTFWSGPPTSPMPLGASCTLERLGGTAVYYPLGGGGPGSLPIPEDSPFFLDDILEGPNGLSPVSFVPPPADRIGDIRCLLVQVWAKKGINTAPFEEVARLAFPVPLDGAPSLPLPPLPGLPHPPALPHLPPVPPVPPVPSLAVRITGFSGDFQGVLSPCGGHAVFSVQVPLLPPGPPALHGDPTAPARCLQVAVGSHAGPLARVAVPWYGALL